MTGLDLFSVMFTSLGSCPTYSRKRGPVVRVSLGEQHIPESTGIRGNGHISDLVIFLLFSVFLLCHPTLILPCSFDLDQRSYGTGFCFDGDTRDSDGFCLLQCLQSCNFWTRGLYIYIIVQPFPNRPCMSVTSILLLYDPSLCYYRLHGHGLSGRALRQKLEFLILPCFH